MKRITQAKRSVGHVYLLQEAGESRICKVGVSTKPAHRLISHQISNWRKLQFAAVFDCRSQTISERIERHVLSVFREHIVSGEWLDVPVPVVTEEIQHFCAQNGIVMDDASSQLHRASG